MFFNTTRKKHRKLQGFWWVGGDAPRGRQQGRHATITFGYQPKGNRRPPARTRIALAVASATPKATKHRKTRCFLTTRKKHRKLRRLWWVGGDPEVSPRLAAPGSAAGAACLYITFGLVGLWGRRPDWRATAHAADPMCLYSMDFPVHEAEREKGT